MGEIIETDQKIKGTDIAVVSDIHLARHWDEIEKIVGNRIKFLNPNRELRNLVDALNLDDSIGSVVTNGDAVDYFYSDRIEESDFDPCKARANNWDLFNEIMNGITKPHVQIPGNHDYRTEPYNYWIYGLKHVNVPEVVRKQFAHKIKHNTFTGPLELGSIGVVEALFDPLQKYQGLKCPTEQEVEGRHCLFLDTGSDAYVRPRNWFKYLAKSFNVGRFGNDTDGLTKEDICALENSLEDHPETYVFMHAPIINPRERNLGKEYTLSIDGFLKGIALQGLADRVILNRGGQILDRLRKSEGNNVVVASHIHDTNYLLIDKESLVAKEVDISEFNERLKDPRYIKHATTLPLGAVSHYREKKIGYTTIGSDGFKEVVKDIF